LIGVQMAVSSLEEIIEQRRRQKETAQRNAQRTATRGNPTRTKDDEYKPPARPVAKLPPGKEKDDVYKPPPKVVVPTRQVPKDDKVTPARKPIYEPVQFVPAGNSQRTKDDQSQPQKYVPKPYLPPGKEKDDKDTRPTRQPITPIKYTPALISYDKPLEVGLSTDRPDTNTPGMYQSQVAQAPTVALDTRGWKPERTKDDDAFPEKQTPGWGAGWGASGTNTGFNAGVSPGLRYLAGAVGDWGKVGDVAKDALMQSPGVVADQANDVKDFLRPDTGATNNPAWDYFGNQVKERADKFKEGLGTWDYTNPLQGAFTSSTQTPQERIAAIQSGEGTEVPAYIDPAQISENMRQNVVATPRVGAAWRATGDFLANAGDALNAFGQDVQSTRVPTPMEDGSVSNAATLGEVGYSPRPTMESVC
jgi:hypothetical protein